MCLYRIYGVRNLNRRVTYNKGLHYTGYSSYKYTQQRVKTKVFMYKYEIPAFGRDSARCLFMYGFTKVHYWNSLANFQSSLKENQKREPSIALWNCIKSKNTVELGIPSNSILRNKLIFCLSKFDSINYLYLISKKYIKKVSTIPS